MRESASAGSKGDGKRQKALDKGAGLGEWFTRIKGKSFKASPAWHAKCASLLSLAGFGDCLRLHHAIRRPLAPSVAA